MRSKVLWIAAALVLIAIPAVVGLVALRGDDGSSSASRRSAALIQAGMSGGFELTVDGLGLPTGTAIDVNSWQWGVSNSSTTTTAGKAQMSELNFTKSVDEASPKLFAAAASGKHYTKAVLTCRKAGDKPVEYMVVTLEDVIVSNAQYSGSGGDIPVESVSLNYSKLTIEYLPEGGATPTRSFYDLRYAKVG